MRSNTPAMIKTATASLVKNRFEPLQRTRLLVYKRLWETAA